jgi:hypothetical protein
MSEPPVSPEGFWARAQNVDRRYLYLLLVAAVALPTFVGFSLPIRVFDETTGVYQAIEAMPEDKVALLMCNWGPGSKGENWPQTEGVIHHMLRKGVRFIIMGADTVGPTLGQQMAERIAPRYGRGYGEDWVSFGYKYWGDAQLLSFSKDVPGFTKSDIRRTPAEEVPMMRGVRDMSDIPLVIEVSAGPEIDRWIRLVQPTYKTTLAFGATAVMAPGYYPYLDSGQLAGMLVGMRGGAEYEALLMEPGQATQGMTLQSMAHLLIAALVVLGNVGYIATRRRARR